jgi:uncharacterized protein (TIGR02757 family)
MTYPELKELLDEKHEQYNCPAFIEADPVSVPHSFTRKEDVEIAGFFAATLAWGQRPIIIRSSMLLMQMMDQQPYEFISTASEQEISRFGSFVYRTFNGHDCMFLIRALKNMYANHGGPEAVFTQAYLRHKDIKESISAFRSVLLDVPHDKRSEKHISNAAKDSACKRINLYLRWMVRNDNRGVDFGLWKCIPASALYLPLDLHTGNTSRELGLLGMRQNNWKAVAELTENLRKMDASDPVKYDYALFGLGVYDKLGG